MKKNSVKGVDYVFQKNPDLSEIGTKEQYEKYLKTIFPKSEVHDIVYHGTDIPLQTDNFDPKYVGDLGVHFGTIKAAEDRIKVAPSGEKTNYSKIFPVLLNLNNLWNIGEYLREPSIVAKQFYKKSILTKEEYYSIANIKNLREGFTKLRGVLTDKGYNSFHYINEHEDINSDSYVATNPEQIHILGSKKDINGFKNFVGKKNKRLEKIVSGIFVFSFLAGLFLSSGNLTGNVIGNSGAGNKLLGIVLILFGIGGFFVYRKLK